MDGVGGGEFQLLESLTSCLSSGKGELQLLSVSIAVCLVFARVLHKLLV